MIHRVNLAAPASVPADTTELIAEGILGRFLPNDAARLVGEWASRLPSGGTLSVCDLDLGAVADGYAEGRLTADDLAGALYANGRRFTYHMAATESLMTRVGLTVTFRRVDGAKFVVKGVKS